MRVFGNIMNRIQEGTKAEEPAVGVGVTILQYSDRDAGTIVEVRRFKTGKKAGQPKELVVQRDRAIRLDQNGMSESQHYEFERDPKGQLETFRANQAGVFVDLVIGRRDKYHDYGF